MDVVIGDREYFPAIERICFEGQESDNPFAFQWYDEERVVGDRTMREHLRFAVAWWHGLGGTGADPFGAPTMQYPWTRGDDPLVRARRKMDAAFELIGKLGLPFYCFHDFDLVEEGDTLLESERRLATMVECARKKQAASGVRLLWGTANLFSHPRYMNGAATNPDFEVVAHAAAQVKTAIDATIELGGENYVFWGGREGYLSLLNTDMKREQEHLARFLHVARDHARAQGFTGTFLIEPKPMEPCKHQYDFDAATVIGFLERFDLTEDFRLNIEVNHATLAGHSFPHELQVAADAGMLGSIDANRGDPQNGWDTDQFPLSVPETVEAMLVILEVGGLHSGGINFDAKVRRNSIDPEDLVLAHIGGIDVFARALLVAHRILDESPYREWRRERYASFDHGRGAEFEAGKLSLEELHAHALELGEPTPISGRQELHERLINQYL
jgi:xylose isomerase